MATVKHPYEYKEADKYVVLNDNDPDLIPIVLKLPKPPPLHLIDGYGLPPEEQRFKRLEIPRKLIDLEAEAVLKTKERMSSNVNNVVTLLKIQKTFWELLQSRHKELKKELDFIRKVWWFRLNGYFTFINGKPYYLAGWHFWYLNFWTMDTNDGAGRPSYRDRDRKEFLFYTYACTTTETFSRLDKDGYAIKEDNGHYKMTDLGLRVCYGTVQSKNRRSGNTNKSLSCGLEIISRMVTSEGGIQSYSNDNAAEHHQTKLMPAFDRLPIWLKPNTRSGRTSTELEFDVGKNEYGEMSLQSKITYATTSSHAFYDGKKLKFILLDEQGKTSQCSILKRWDVTKNCLSQGNGRLLNGAVFSPSTVDEIEAAESAQDYRFLCSNSNFYRRIKATGQSYSGLFRIFVPATEGLDGFIDSYGYSVKDKILPHQSKEKFIQTALEYLQGKRDALLTEGSPESMRAYREEKKLFPLFYGDSWLGEAGSIGFDLEKIDSRLSELRRGSNIRTGRLEWTNGFGSDVYFVDDIEKGYFEVSMMPPEDTTNKRQRVMAFNYLEGKNMETWMPVNMKKGTIGADPIKNVRKQEAVTIRGVGKSDKLSDGGISGYLNYNPEIDGGVLRSQRKTDKFIISYRYRHSNADAYNEDVLKCMIWTGFPIYVETNVDTLVTYLIKNGYSGFLIYDIDYNGQIKQKPGVDTSGQSKQRLFSLLRDYIDFRCHQEEFEKFLQECKSIRAIEEMRYYDRLTAHGLALMGSQSPYLEMFARINGIDENSYDLDNFL